MACLTPQRRTIPSLLFPALLILGCGDSTAPPEITDTDLVKAVSAGGYRTCAITRGGALYCWGERALESWRLDFEPVRVSGISGVVESVSVGFGHNCVVTDADEAYCWGSNLDGQLGTGGPSRVDPTRVLGPVFASVFASRYHSCGLTRNGEAYCWGFNGWGNLGDGTTENRIEPVPVATSARFTQLSVGLQHTCGVTTGGETLCWGRNDIGQIGDGTTSNERLEPTPVEGGERFRSVHASGWFTCALTESGTAHCWGAESHGYGPAPGPVAGSFSFRSLAVGGWNHVCGLTHEGETYCWGFNSHGQLGTGTLERALEPTRVLTTERFADLAAGTHHTCGLTPSGVVFCWGWNGRGQLGDGRVAHGWLTPVPVRW